MTLGHYQLYIGGVHRGSVVQVSVTRGQSRHVTEVTSTDLTKSKVMMRVIPFLETVFKQ